MERPGDFAWEVRVAASEPGTAGVYVRSCRFEVGAPVTFDHEDPHVSALEYVLGAVGGEIVVGLRRPGGPAPA